MEAGIQLEGELHQCQKKLQEWNYWSATNIPKHEALVQDYEELQRQRTFDSATITIAILAVGIGMGLGLLSRLVRSGSVLRHQLRRSNSALSLFPLSGSLGVFSCFARMPDWFSIRSISSPQLLLTHYPPFYLEA